MTVAEWVKQYFPLETSNICYPKSEKVITLTFNNIKFINESGGE